MHKRLLGDMLDSIDSEINAWKTVDFQHKTVLDAVNHVDNAIFCVNTIHIISQLADILTNACGGLLPLLASATTINSVNFNLNPEFWLIEKQLIIWKISKNDIEIMENTEGMTNQEGVQFLERVMRISDVIILGCNTSFAELEQEKNLPNGAILRQALRLSNFYFK